MNYYIYWCLTQPNIIYTFRCWLLIFPSHQQMIRLIFISLQFSVKFPRSHVSESSSSSGSRCGFLRFVGNKKWSRWSDQFYVYVDIVVDVEKNHLFQGCVGVTTVLNRGGNHHLYPEEKTLISSYLVLARRACVLRALGLLLADGAPTVGGGKTFWAVSRIFLRKQL